MTYCTSAGMTEGVPQALAMAVLSALSYRGGAARYCSMLQPDMVCVATKSMREISEVGASMGAGVGAPMMLHCKE